MRNLHAPGETGPGLKVPPHSAWSYNQHSLGPHPFCHTPPSSSTLTTSGISSYFRTPGLQQQRKSAPLRTTISQKLVTDAPPCPGQSHYPTFEVSLCTVAQCSPLPGGEATAQYNLTLATQTQKEGSLRLPLLGLIYPSSNPHPLSLGQTMRRYLYWSERLHVM